MPRFRYTCQSGLVRLKNLDVFQNARRVFLEAVETTELTIVQKVMREMGAKGGKIGGKRRLETMTDEQRKSERTKSR